MKICTIEQHKSAGIMARKDSNNFEFILYLYNQFVGKHRSIGKEARVYWHILDMYVELGLSKKSQTAEKKYAQKLIAIIREAVMNWNTHLLILKGEEGEKEYQENMKSYIERLYRLGHDEQSVIESIIKKLKLNYGNDN
ncbi:hypothetical protein B0A68_12525 [Flavobacterium reichenbachii]|uniref:Uncharacterized protein n=2 Tax=Flavobacterium reichenbachii TaxID=362418 RepID=A0A085ZJ74_9FLAO|nr:hypothetical protein IW19_02610 [Flavobacterium reichenbachii]OXB14463.1 hypothetical protein B0A68_12525 [Flavobacterium reichenbachii]